MVTTTLTGPPAAYITPIAPPRQQQQRATRPVESTASSSGGGSQAASVPTKPKDAPVTFPPAPGLIDLIMRAQDAKDAEREVREEFQKHAPPQSYSRGSTDPPEAGASVDAYT